MLRLKLQIRFANLADGLAHSLAVGRNGQVDHGSLHLMFKIGGHGVGEGRTESHAKTGLPVVSRGVGTVHVILCQVIRHGKVHARFRQVLPHGVGLRKTLDFNVHRAVDQGGRLLDGQKHAVVKRKDLLGVVQVGHGGFELCLVFNRHTRCLLKPVLGRKFRRLDTGFLGTGPGQQCR